MSGKVPVRLWKGTRAQYNAVATGAGVEATKRYIVSEVDGRITEYFGTTPVSQVTGQLFPVKSVVSSLPSTLAVGDRYLVGHDATFDASGNVVTQAEYYVVEIAADRTLSSVNPLGDFSVRVIDRDYMEYCLVDGVLTTYELGLDCGTF